jgi:hypothetical protein
MMSAAMMSTATMSEPAPGSRWPNTRGADDAQTTFLVDWSILFGIVFDNLKIR